MPERGLSQEPISAMEAAIAYADAMAANADQWTLKRVKKLPNQLRAGAEKVARWKELELTKHMVGKVRVEAYFWVWRLKMLLADSGASCARTARRQGALHATPGGRGGGCWC